MKRIIVPLSGGLGNQLFQYYAGKSLKPSDLLIDFSLSKNDSHRNGIDILELLSEGDQKICNVKFPFIQKLAKKTFGFCTRYSTEIPSGTKGPMVYHTVLTILSSLVFSIYFGKPCHTFISKGIGCTSRVRKNTFGHSILIGYFQTLQPFDRNYGYLHQDYLRKVLEKEVTEPQEKEVANPRNLSIHMRLGDYLNEPKIGCLDPLYFARAIEKLGQNKIIDRIILFSDDEEFALNELNIVTSIPISVFPTASHSSSFALFALSNASNLIISNSSFSWWAAMISSCRQQATIAAPEKWFAGQPDPISLIPTHWTRIKSSWRSLEPHP
jgi:hypothetical protein